MHPLKFKLVDDKHLFIQWDDNSETTLSLHKMRTMCPCATCSTERLNHSNSYIPVLLSSQFKVTGIEEVGNYAIKIEWKDGHNTGIYEYSSLHKYIADQSKAKI